MSQSVPRRLLSVLASALVLPLLALPVAADGRASPENHEARGAFAVEGTVSAITSLPTPGSAPVLSLLGGLISIDTAGADVKLPDGSTGTVADIAVSSRIVALVADPGTSTGPLAAQLIVILGIQDEVTLRGTVQAVDASAMTFQMLGLTIHVTDKTSFGGPFEGASTSSIDDLHVGDQVQAGVTAVNDEIVARRVIVTTLIPPETDRYTGTVKSIAADAWVVTVDGTDTTFAVNAATKIVGDPKVGDKVDVLAQKDSSGALTALLIVGRPAAPGPATRLHGVVKETNPTAWVITVSERDVTVGITDKTKFVGDPKVGDTVDVVGQYDPSGALTALMIMKSVPVPTPPAVVVFRGVVQTIASDAWEIKVGDAVLDVLVTDKTRIIGTPKVGDTVDVAATKADDGTLTALTIALAMSGAPNPSPGQSSFVGTVKAISPLVWTVGDVHVLITPMTKIEGKPAVGDTVKVTGRKAANGDFVAQTIEKE